jgi:hypothetical protein
VKTEGNLSSNNHADRPKISLDAGSFTPTASSHEEAAKYRLAEIAPSCCRCWR